MLTVKRALVALFVAAAVAAGVPAAADAQSGWGTFTDRNGVPCTYNQMGDFISGHCSGYTRSGAYVSYSFSCYYTRGFGWSCS